LNKMAFQKGHIPWSKGKELNKEKYGHVGFQKRNQFYKLVKNRNGGFKKGYIPWNKDLNAEIDDRIKYQNVNISKGLKKAYSSGKRIGKCDIKTREKIRQTLTGNIQSFDTRKKESLSIRRIKEENWNGFSNMQYGIEYRKIRNKVLKKDNYRCSWCGKKEDLIIHHIDKDKHNNVISNLITFCRSCHTKIHFSELFFEKIIERGLIKQQDDKIYVRYEQNCVYL